MANMHKLARLRNIIAAIAIGANSMGCSFAHNGFAHWSLFHCDECDDFPTPGYGPGYSMMPGSYAGPAPGQSDGSSQPTSAAPTGSQATPGEAPTPPAPPPAGPAPASASGSGARSTMVPGAMPTETENGLPPLPGMTQNELQVPPAIPAAGTALR
jgi:hypothetical protein